MKNPDSTKNEKSSDSWQERKKGIQRKRLRFKKGKNRNIENK